MSNGGSLVTFCPSDTLITIPRYVATLAAVGVPISVPFAVLKLSHWGF
jgi:hypothetical protein